MMTWSCLGSSARVTCPGVREGPPATDCEFGTTSLRFTSTVTSLVASIRKTVTTRRAVRLDARISEIVRPRETALITDGVTWRDNNLQFGGQFFTTALGCEGTFMHVTSSNSLLADGHSAALPGNPEEIRVIGTDGNWIERY